MAIKALVHLFGGVTMQEVEAKIAQANTASAVIADMFGTGPAPEVRAQVEAHMEAVKESYQDHLDTIDAIEEMLKLARAQADEAKQVVSNVKVLVDNLPAPDFKVNVVPFTPIKPLSL